MSLFTYKLRTGTLPASPPTAAIATVPALIVAARSVSTARHHARSAAEVASLCCCEFAVALVPGGRGKPDEGTDLRPLPTRRELRTEQAMVPREAFFAHTEHVKPKDAVGRISAELVTAYPPGIPVAAPGKVYNEAIVYYLEQVVAAGGFVEGAADQSLSKFRVVATGG